MPTFTATLTKTDPADQLGKAALITLPKASSAALPSRSITMVAGTINGASFRVPVEPDGQGSHWFALDSAALKALGLAVGDRVSLECTPTKNWTEPTKLPANLAQALTADTDAQALWNDITPMARWDWLNWMDAVKLPKTRDERPAKLISMLKHGKRRPCCFNRALRTIPKVAVLG